ncbi:sensor histidine kinase [Actinomadura rupiterrae]|uniref:sensor histidine kinase n=1 Tax=Actinomadura rupiterrae TaxID=559627 RepID=UPI0020A4DAAF|nr:sensor histidine kinase [Actinomadura rupiterrae]MCP2334879.1 sensor histidine kinase regulating citrate/malate metabolism [Actinomadura rupiterrae]
MARQLLALHLALVVVLVAASAGVAYEASVRAARDRARQAVTSVAASVADAPTVRDALLSAGPGARLRPGGRADLGLQPFAERVRVDGGVDFVTIMTPEGVRLTHPDPRRIGQRYLGTIAPAQQGRRLTETYTGTLGPSVRTIVPVFADAAPSDETPSTPSTPPTAGPPSAAGRPSRAGTPSDVASPSTSATPSTGESPSGSGTYSASGTPSAGGTTPGGESPSAGGTARGGESLSAGGTGAGGGTTSSVGGERVVGLVSVGITVRAISAELRERLVPLALVAVAVLGLGVVGSVLVGARLRRQTRGVAPDELRRMFDYYEAILHAVREGLVLVDRDGRVVLCNDAARDLLSLPADPTGRPVTALGLGDELVAAFTSSTGRADEIHVADTRVLVVNTVPVRSRGKAMGTVVTLRDHTDLQSLMGELDSVRGFAESLRAQAHEAANRLHTVVSLVELGRPADAVEFATAELATAQELTDRVVGAVREPVLAALLLGKSAEAAERGAELVVTSDSEIGETGGPGRVGARDLVTILGNLVDNALDAAIENAAARAPRVEVTVRTDADGLLLKVADSGPGVAREEVPAMFRRGWSTKPESGHAGLGLALVGRAVRRYEGSIDVSTPDGGGAIVSVRLPSTEGTPQ